MDQIKHLGKNSEMGAGAIKITWYADDAVIVSECEDELQRLIFILLRIMQISIKNQSLWS